MSSHLPVVKIKTFGSVKGTSTGNLPRKQIVVHDGNGHAYSAHGNSSAGIEDAIRSAQKRGLHVGICESTSLHDIIVNILLEGKKYGVSEIPPYDPEKHGVLSKAATSSANWPKTYKTLHKIAAVTATAKQRKNPEPPDDSGEVDVANNEHLRADKNSKFGEPSGEEPTALDKILKQPRVTVSNVRTAVANQQTPEGKALAQRMELNKGPTFKPREADAMARNAQRFLHKRPNVTLAAKALAANARLKLRTK